MNLSKWWRGIFSQRYTAVAEQERTLLAESEKHSDDAFSDDDVSHPGKPSQRSFIKTSLVAVNLILFVTSCLLFLPTVRQAYINSQSRHCQNSNFDNSPAREAIQYEPQLIDNNLNIKNIYKGNPSPELDEAWEDLVNDMNTRVSKETLDRINRTSIPLQDGSGDYWVNFAVYHNLHCLKTVRQYIAKEHYPDMAPAFRKLKGEIYPTHIDHCIDSLRQYIMCNADVSMITYSWDPKERHGIPVPNFNVQHQCVNYDRFSRWSKQHRFSLIGPILRHPKFGVPFPEESIESMG